MTTQIAPWHAQFTAAYPELLRFLRRRTGDVGTARDLAHDTWVRLAERNVSIVHVQHLQRCILELKLTG